MHFLVSTGLGVALAGASATMTIGLEGSALSRSASDVIAGTALHSASEIAGTVQLYEMQEGRPLPQAGLQALVADRYLKILPPNPAKSGDAFIARLADGSRAVAFPIDDDNVCDAAEKVGNPGLSGCLRDTSGMMLFVKA